MVRRLLPVEAADRCWLHFTLAAHRQFHSRALEECINFRMMAATPQANVIVWITNIRRNRQRQTSGRLADQARGDMVGNQKLRKVIGGAKDPSDSDVGDVRRNSSPNGESLAINWSELVSIMNVSVNQRSAMDDQLSRPQFNGSEPFHFSGGSDIPMQWLEIFDEAKRSGFR